MDTTIERFATQDVMLRYAAGVDDRDMALYGSCFAEDVEVVGFGAETIRGRGNWVDYVSQALEAYGPTQHMLSPQYAEIEGDTARTRSDVQALHYLKDPAGSTLTLWATYKTDMRKVDGEWKIIRHELISRGTKVDPSSG